MIKIPMLALAGMLLFSVTAQAAGNDEGRDGADRMSNELQLSPDQKAKLEAIFNEKHEKIRAIREQAQARVREVLSEEQFSQWEQLKKRHREKRASFGADDTPANR